MNRELGDKCHIQPGKVVIVTKAGEEYVYCDGELTPLAATDDPEGRAGLEGGSTSAV